MKQTIRLIILAAMLAVALPIMSQAQTTPAAAAGECTDEIKSALYTEFLNNWKKTPEHPNADEDVAYNAAKKYLTACPVDETKPPTDEIQKPGRFMKKWMAAYEVGDRKARFLAAYDKKDYPTTMTVGKTVLADDPNYTRGYVLLGYIGYLASLGKNPSLNAESANYAKQAITMLESGKTPDDWRPFVNKEDTLAWLNYSLGFMVKDTSPNDAIPYFMKATKVESNLKKNPAPYFFIAEGYETLYGKQEADYTTKYKDKPETPESKLASENINQLIDRVIDAYARAIALSTASDATTQDKKKEWTARLTELYKYRTKTDGAGVPELVAGILAKPLPEMPKPITSLPTPPATGATTPPAGTPPSATTTTPPAKPAAVTTTPAPKPTAPPTTQAAKPKPKSNHRRR